MEKLKSPDDPSSTSLRVLIVEDSADDAELIAMQLKSEGFQFAWQRVETEAAYSAALESDHDLILSDWRLPQFSGMRALQLIQERGKDIPFVIISGSIGEPAAIDALRQGAYDYVLKDRPDRLGQAVSHALEQKRLRYERRSAEEVLRLQYELILALNATSDMEVALLHILDTALQFESIDCGGIYLVDPETKYLDLVIQRGLSESFRHTVSHIPPDFPPVAQARLGEVTYREKTTFQPEMSEEQKQEGITTLISIPVMHQEELIAIINLATHAGSVIPTSIRSALQTLAQQISSTLMRLRADRALRESEEKHRILLDESTGPIFSFSPQGVYTYVNRAFANGVGMTVDQIIGKHIWDVFSQEEADKRFAPLTTVFQTGVEKNIEVRVPRPDGDRFYITTITPIKDEQGKVITVICSSKDITERVRAEAALRDSEQQLATLISNLPGFVYRCKYDDHYTMEFISEGCQEITGYSAETFIQNTDFSFNDLLTLEYQETIWEKWQKVLEEKRPFEEEYPIITASGEIRWVWERGRGVFSKTGELLYLEGFITDITERVQAAEEKAKMQDQLLQVQKMESIGRLAGGVAHDFNNLLGVILGHAEKALKTIPHDQEAYQDLEKIYAAAGHSAELTRQLLAFARKQTIAPRVMNVNLIIENMLKMLRRLIGEDIRLIWHPQADLWPVKVDPVQIDQIIVNLLINAQDAISGSGAITIETKNVSSSVVESALRPGMTVGDYILLEVCDDGAGMDEETQSHIFEPFFTTKHLGRGTGLGLSTVYGVVRQNNGCIEVRSAPTQGTTFCIYLPRAAAAATQADAVEQNIATVGGRETLLLVEDEEALLELGKETLEELGYSVLAASTPGTALHLASEHTGEINLLITDVVMPGMNGKVLAEEIRAIQPGLKCLFMSGYTADVIAVHGVLEEGVAFLQKPFALNDLAIMVRQLLG